MPEYTYISRSESGTEGVTLETGFDTSQFGDVELLGTVLQFKEAKKSLWEQIGLGGSIVAKAVAYKGRVYFGCCDKNFYCVDRKTGEEVWRFSTNGLMHNESGAAFRDGVVYFCCADGNLYAVDAESGELRWKFKTRGPLYGDPTTDGDRVYFSSKDGSIYSVNAESGELVWKLDVNAHTLYPAVHKGRIYAGWRDSTLFCISVEGKVLWKFFAKDDVASWPPAFSEKHIYFGSWDNNLYCIDFNGKMVWTFKAGDVSYPPVLYEGKIYFGSRDYCVYCLNAANGSLVWKFKTGGFVVNITIQNNRIYFGSWDNNVYCLDTATGKEVWKFPTNGFVTTVGVYEGRVYAGSWDCNLYCLDAETGKLLWKFKTSIGTPSTIAPPEAALAKSVEITWAPVTEEEEKKYKKGEVDIADYGSFSGNYIQVGKSDYLGRKKKGYM